MKNILKPSARRSRVRSVLALISTTIFMFLIIACSNDSNTPSANHILQVTATTGMISDVVREVGGEHTEVANLMGPGIDPHLYKATQGDIRKLEKANIIFYNGLFLEGKMVDIFEKMKKNKTVVAVTDNIDRALLRSGEEMDTQYDPHLWFNVRHWMSVTETIRDTLIAFDPAHADDYQKNAESYLQQLTHLHEEVIEQISTIPEKSRVLVTAHDAFGYFGEAYGIEVIGLQGMSTAAEVGTKDVTDLRDYLVEHQIKAVFVESSVSSKSLEAVIQGAKSKGHDIVIGGELFSDAMGEEGTFEGTYIGMIRHNVETIVQALK